jgi:hypothetical protein
MASRIVDSPHAIGDFVEALQPARGPQFSKMLAFLLHSSSETTLDRHSASCSHGAYGCVFRLER